jgi:hypothetical protein
MHQSQTTMAIILIYLLAVTNACLGFSSIIPSDKPSGKLPKPEFMTLYNNFVGYSKDANNPGIGQALSDTLAKKAATQSGSTALILAINSDLYIYDENGKKLLQQAIRADPDTGFFELTAISHLGPAVSYLLAIKNNGGDWKPLMQQLQKNIQAVQTVNNDKKDPWLKSVNAVSWQPYLSKIQAMNTYGLAMTNAFLDDILSGKIEFNAETVNDQYFSGNNKYPIPFNNVMIGTFMLTTLTEMYDLYMKIKPLNLDWKNTQVILRFVAGTNFTSGLTLETNWIGYYLKSASQGQIPRNNIFVIPYAEIKPSLGKDQLTAADQDYYTNYLWRTVKQRTSVARNVFSSIPSMYIPARAAIPGDYNFSKKDDIDDFVIRLKHSLSDATEMLSNATAYWMAGELAAKNWDYNKIDIPGLTTGFPEGVTAYPAVN